MPFPHASRTGLATGLLVLVLGATGRVAAEDPDGRLRGDLPPSPLDVDALLSTRLDGREAAALFARLHGLLLERVGTDVISDTDLYMGAIQGMIDVVNRRQAEGDSQTRAALPPAAMVLTQPEADQLRGSLDGRITGIGIEFQLYSRLGVIRITRVLPNSPAEVAGLIPDDQIVALDGRSFAGLGLPGVLALLQGNPGSPIALQFQRGAGLSQASYTVAVERRSFDLRSVQDELRPGGLGYLRVFQFHRGTPGEVEESLLRLAQLGADRIVLDLRDSAGGDLLSALSVANLFLPEGTVLARVLEPGIGERDIVAKRPQVCAANLVVLVNNWTHGSAEAVAAALQEHHRAYVIGEPTMGSGRTETLIDLGHSLVLRLDSVRLQSPTGRSWAGRGVLPDQPFWTTSGGGGSGDEGASDPLYEVAVHYLETEGF